MIKENLIPIPEVGAKPKFFDDGKIYLSRMYDATVTMVMYRDTAKGYKLSFPNKSDMNLYDFWRKEIDNHRNTDYFQVLPYKIGEPWLYANDTDFFIFCDIPDYSDYPVIFVRHVDGSWFSLGYPYSSDGGTLDVTGELYKSITNE